MKKPVLISFVGAILLSMIFPVSGVEIESGTKFHTTGTGVTFIMGRSFIFGKIEVRPTFLRLDNVTISIFPSGIPMNVTILSLTPPPIRFYITSDSYSSTRFVIGGLGQDMDYEIYQDNNLITESRTNKSGYLTFMLDIEIGTHLLMISLSRNPADLNGDGQVDINDLILVASHFGQTEGDEGWNVAVDIVVNGEIDIYDLIFVASRFT